MPKLELQRVATVGGQTIVMHFEMSGYRYKVKNLTDGNIYAALEDGATKEESVLIPAGCAEILLVNECAVYADSGAVVQIIPEATSEEGVEVQCIRW